MKITANNESCLFHCLSYVLEGHFTTKRLLNISEETLTTVHRELTEYVSCTMSLELTVEDVKQIWCCYIDRAVDNGTIVCHELTADNYADVSIKDFARKLLCERIMQL